MRSRDGNVPLKKDIMKRLLSVLMCIVCNVSGMQIARNAQMCFNNIPRGFGTTHFIRGYASHNKVAPQPEKEVVVNQIQPIIDGSSAHLLDSSRLIQAFFPSIHNIPSIILDILSKAQKTIQVAAFALTDNRIAKELINAHKRGVDVSVIMDENNIKQPYSKGQMLADNKISVKYYNPLLRSNYKKKRYVPLMHRKCCIVDGKLVITGSANFTGAGLGSNVEDINVISCEHTVAEQIAEHDRLDKCSTKLKPNRNIKE